jgi:AcrR family transcriptional regulator
VSIVRRTTIPASQADQNGRRRYTSPQRAAAAQVTRDRIRTAATKLFLADGYSGTSIRAIADLAGVAEKTVYLQFANKSALLNEVVGAAIVGDGDQVAAADRRWFRDIVESPEPATKVRLLAAATAALHERTGAVFAMALGAAAVDAEAADLWRAGKQGHLADMTRLAESFAAAGMIPAGLDLSWAVRTLYVLVGLETWHLIRREVGNDPAEYHTWLLHSLGATFDLGAAGKGKGPWEGDGSGRNRV